MQNDKPYIEQVANMLGVELLEEFKIRPTKLAKVMGYKEDEEANPKDMEQYYPQEEQAKYGVVGIEIEVIDNE